LALAPNLYNVCSAISDCGTYGAQVTCLINLSQGATGCVEIQIYDKNLNRADLSQFNVIQVLVTDTGNNVVAIFSEPPLIGNYFDRPLEILTDGHLKGCFTSEMTSNSMTGRLSAEIKMIKEASTGEIEDVVIIRCIQIGTIRSSSFSLGFTEEGVTVGPGGGGGGTVIGVTSGTSGSSGYNGTSGTSGFGTDGTSGTSGTSGSGTSGSDGTSGTSGENGTSGTSGENGTSGTSGVGTDGTSGTSGVGTDGTSGTSGVGTDGTSGISGSSGTSGISGSSGTSGSGVDGAVTLRWTLQNTSGANPSGAAYFTACCNSGLLNTGSFIFSYTSSTVQSEGFWDTIANAISSGLTPYLQIVQVNNPNVVGLYEITAVSYADPGNGGQYAVTANGVPAVYASGLWSTGEQYTVSFSLNGQYGTSGTSGTSSTSGTSGENGTSGTSGDGTSGTSGAAGSSGTSGVAGSSGTSGTSGTSGAAGSSGTSGVAGSSGTSGTSGVAGSSGTSGIGTNGTSGSSGTSGSGSSGTSGTSGATGSSGTAGTSGTSGSPINNAYASFSNSQNIPVTAADTATVWTYDTTEISSNISVVSNSRITVATAGVYEIAYSPQIEKTQGTDATVTIWAVKNGSGTPEVRSSSTLQLVANSVLTLPFVSLVFNLNANDYIEFYFSSNSQYVRLTSIGTQTGPTRPASPSVIIVAKQIGTAVGYFSSPYSGNINVTSGQAWVSADANGNTTASTTVDWNTGNVQTFTLNSATTTFTFSNGQAGATYMLIIRQNASGSQVISWPGTIAWSGASTPTMTATASRYDVYTFVFDGSKYFGSYVQNYT